MRKSLKGWALQSLVPFRKLHTDLNGRIYLLPGTQVFITAAMCRAGRLFLGLSQWELSHRSGVSVSSIQRFESGHGRTFDSVKNDLRRHLEKGGVKFVENGVLPRGQQ